MKHDDNSTRNLSSLEGIGGISGTNIPPLRRKSGDEMDWSRFKPKWLKRSQTSTKPGTSLLWACREPAILGTQNWILKPLLSIHCHHSTWNGTKKLPVASLDSDEFWWFNESLKKKSSKKKLSNWTSLHQSRNCRNWRLNLLHNTDITVIRVALPDAQTVPGF